VVEEYDGVDHLRLVAMGFTTICTVHSRLKRRLIHISLTGHNSERYGDSETMWGQVNKCSSGKSMAADQCASGPNPWRGINSPVVNAPAVKCTSSKRTARNERTEVNPCGGGQSLRWWSIPVAVVNPCGSGQSLWWWSILVAAVNPCGSGQSLRWWSIFVVVVNP